MFSILENKRLVNDKIRLQNIRLIISNRVQMFSILENKRLTTKYDFKTSVSSFQIESKCFQYLKISVLRQNTTSKHPFHYFKMFSILENKRLTTKYDFKTSVSS